MNFDDYLTEYYGFNTQDKRWRMMGNQGKNLLRDSFKMDMAKEQETKDDTKVAKL